MSKIATREAYGKALVKLGKINDDVVVLDADLSKSTKTNDFCKAYPNRFFNMGIAEQNLVGAACGFAAAEFNGPMYVRLGRSAVPTLFDEDYNFEIGKGVVLKEGNDATIIACGMMVNEAILAADMLKEENINVRVINMSTIKPIDTELIIKAAKETKAIVTAEEHSIIGGLGSAVSEVVSENCPIIVKKVGINDCFGESGTPAELLEKYGLTAKHIVEKVKEAMQ